MHYRHARGFNSLSINWGAWAEVGMAANLSFKQQGTTAIPPGQGGHVLVELIQKLNRHASPQIVVQPTHWREYLSHASAKIPFYEHFAHHLPNAKEAQSRQTAGGAPEKISLRQQLQTLPETDRDALLMAHLEKTAAGVLGLAPNQKIDHYQGLMNMGLDSLMAVEFRNHLARSLERALPATLLFNYPTLELLRGYLLVKISDDGSLQKAGQGARHTAGPADGTATESKPEGNESVDDIARMLARALNMPQRNN
jgi:hypothetical protein